MAPAYSICSKGDLLQMISYQSMITETTGVDSYYFEQLQYMEMLKQELQSLCGDTQGGYIVVSHRTATNPNGDPKPRPTNN